MCGEGHWSKKSWKGGGVEVLYYTLSFSIFNINFLPFPSFFSHAPLKVGTNSNFIQFLKMFAVRKSETPPDSTCLQRYCCCLSIVIMFSYLSKNSIIHFTLKIVLRVKLPQKVWYSNAFYVSLYSIFNIYWFEWVFF